MIPPACVLDTSVIIKWFRQGEVLAQEALALRESFLQGQTEIWLPTLAGYELANALRLKDDLSAAHVQGMVQSLFDMGLEWIALSSVTLCRAVEIARAGGLSVYDAYFVAAAEALGVDFITADERLAGQLSDFTGVRFLGSM